MRWSCWLYPLLVSCSLARADKPLVAAESGSSPPAARGPCELVLSTKVVARARFEYNLQVTIENAAPYDLQFVVPDRCPAGPLDFDGLPDGYDYYQTCTAGACLGPRGQHTVQLRPRERYNFLTVQLSAAGGPCTPPLDRALYQIAAVPPNISYRVCSESARLDLRNVKLPVRPASQPVAPAPAPAPPPPRPTDDPYACTTSEDCVISCPSVRGCCGWPCGCTNAIHRDQVASFVANYASTCTRAPNCPIVACAYEPADRAICHNGRCAAQRGPGGW
ncbi:MAG TPA: hypothetical protein VJV78_48910 [Polyangiales bacterium]|nr:hypothetical protein [Polyangiales bacterium]